MLAEIGGTVRNIFRRNRLDVPTTIIVTRETGLIMVQEMDFSKVVEGVAKPSVVEGANGATYRAFTLAGMDFYFPANKIATERGWRFE